jgi:Fic family protein
MYMKCVTMNMMKPDVPANDLPHLPPDTDIETKSVLRHAITANRELACLKGYCSLLPNETILLNTIVLKEARASSEIENIVTTQDELYRALAADDRQMTPETKEVLNYRSAVWTGYRRLRDTGLITSRTIVAIQEELEGNSAGIRSLPGTALRNDRTGEVVYTPPDDETVIRNLLHDLERYINEDDGVDPLIKMAVMHYQFESIHPFYDGNGRTGRILNVLYLIRCGLLDSPILYLSRSIIRKKPQYYELLQRVRTESAWIPWIEFMIMAVEETSRFTMDLTQAIVSLMEQTTEMARQTLLRTTYSKELIELLFVQPYVKIENLVNQGIAERRTASKYLKQLEEIGILGSYKAWKETIYINRPLMELLEKTE